MYDRRSIWKGEIAMNGKLIVIEGLDGSGKNTQSEKLFTYLKDAGKNVRKVSFPNYSSQSSALINMYLAGEFGSTADWSTHMQHQASMLSTATPATRQHGAISTTKAA